MEWQPIIALGIVTITLGCFGYHLLFRGKPKSGKCGNSCGCGDRKTTPGGFSQRHRDRRSE